jgi:hypothetical protein
MRKYLKVAGIGCGSLLLLIVLIVGAYYFMVLDGDRSDNPPLAKTVTVPAGSYFGRVVDAVTGQGIPGAAVFMCWTVERSLNPLEKLIFFESSTDRAPIGDALAFTDQEGRYRLPQAAVSSRVHWRMHDLPGYVVIYKRGYIGYRLECSFDGKAVDCPDHTEPMERNREVTIKLLPWVEGYDHQQHFSFIRSFDYWTPNWQAMTSLFEWELKIRGSLP